MLANRTRSNPNQVEPQGRPGGEAVILKNSADLDWEAMLPDLGADSPRYAILRVDPVSGLTTLQIEFPRALYIPKHTHEKGETHVILGGSHLFEHEGQQYHVREHGFIYMPGGFVHEAWVPAGAKAVITLDAGWKVDWLDGGPTARDLGRARPGPGHVG